MLEALFLLTGLGSLLYAAGSAGKYAVFNLPSNPPFKGLVTCWNKPIANNDKLLGPGLVVLSPKLNGYWPFINGIIPIPMSEAEQTATVTERTPDGVPLETEFTFEARVRDNSDAAIEFLRSGDGSGDARGALMGAMSQIQDMVQQRIREVIMSADEGPLTYEEAQKARFDIFWLVLERMNPARPVQFQPGVPNYILGKYFFDPEREPTKSEKVRWGKEWEKLKSKLREGCTDGEYEALRQRVLAKGAEFNEFINGNGELYLPAVGMDLIRLNIARIVPTGRMAELASRAAEEGQEQKAKNLRAASLRERVKGFKTDFPNASGEKLLEITMVNDGTIPKQINESQNTIGLTPGTAEAVAKGLVDVLEIARRKSDGKT